MERRKSEKHVNNIFMMKPFGRQNRIYRKGRRGRKEDLIKILEIFASFAVKIQDFISDTALVRKLPETRFQLLDGLSKIFLLVLLLLDDISRRLPGKIGILQLRLNSL